MNNPSPITVGFIAGGTPETRTSIDDNGISTSWSPDDKVALWALNEETQNFALNNQEFKFYFRHPVSKGYFTSELPSVMTEGSYTYYATYPTPTSINGTTATFNLPAIQDGQMSGGAAIMVAEPQMGKAALGALTNTNASDEILDNGLHLSMHHKMHALKFFVMQDKWAFNEGEKIERIIFTMSKQIAGDVSFDYTNPNAESSVANGSNTISLSLAKHIGPTVSAANPDFAAASIIPTDAFGESDEITMKIYSKSQIVRQTISLAGRSAMQAGHITPVAINCSNPTNLPKISFVIKDNYLGEDPYRITLTSEDTNSKWSMTDDHIYEYYTGDYNTIIIKGKGFDVFYDEEILSTLSGKKVKVTYESKNAIVSNVITMPTMTEAIDYSVDLNVPYLFAEDFSTLATYNGDYNGGPYTSTDGASVAAIDLSQHGLSAGWTGARTGCDAAGVAILITGRVDAVALGATRAYGRLESPAMSAIKQDCGVKVKVSFTYSGNESGSYDYYYPVAKCGYTTASGLLNGYATQFNNNQAFTGIDGATDIPSVPTSGNAAAAQTGSKNMEYYIDSCTSYHRLSWHVMQYGFKRWATNNDTGYLYIDNIKVQIVRE
ncbi:MAG: hypothetical protein IKV12_04465 [Alistipes sp.]|nr:hypothetical protein [Alistipes sp.]